MIRIELVLLVIALFLSLSILASKAAARSGVPALLLFLLLGMLAGSDGPGGIYFDSPWLAQSVGVVALAFILFSGGLDTDWPEVRPALRSGLALSTIGVAITALAVGWFASTFLGLSWPEGILLGSIISSTDAAAVFSLLRGQAVNLRGRLKPLLELESGSNDPVAVFLTLGMIQLILNPAQPVESLAPLFIVQMGIGAVVGYVVGRLLVVSLNRLRLEFDGLYPVVTTAGVLLTYGMAAALDGSGFLAVYLAGLVMAQQDFIHRRSLLQFHDGLAWLMQIAMFVTLGLQVYPSRLPSVAEAGLLTALFLILAARPLAVLVTLAFVRFTLREKLFIAWVGLRGAAPIVLATFPLLAGVAKADLIFHLVFFIVLTSVLLQGTLVVPAARLLRVYSRERPRQSPLSFVMKDGMITNNLCEITIAPGSPVVGKQILDLNLPADVLIVLIGREGDLVVPKGGTVLQAEDVLLVLAAEGMQQQVRQLCAAPIDAASTA
mgnify:FL=1